MSEPFITLYTVDSRANKLVTRRRGKITKEAGPPMSEAMAQTVRVDTVDDMAGILRTVGEQENALISLGYTPGTEPADGEKKGPPYTVLSREKLAKRLDFDPDDGEAMAKLHEVDGKMFAVRSKRSMVPGGWMLFDRDITPGMPAHLANMTDDEWLNAMAEMIPGFSDAGLVKLPSTTGRVLVDGQPMEASGSHYFVRVADGDDIERFGAVLLNTSFLYDYGFMRPIMSRVDGSVVSNRAWFIADPSTFSHERLIYDGKPTVKGSGVEVGPVEIKTRPGGILQTCDLKNPTKEEIELVRERTGVELRWETRSRQIGGSWQRRPVPIHLDTRTLTLDTVIETESGNMVLREYWGSGQEKLRCQTPFRDSTSWNGIISFHSNGTPFIFDNGSRTKFVLPDDVVEREHPKAWVSQLRRMPAEDVSRRWTEQLETMSPTSRDEVRKEVHGLTGIDLNVLSAELNRAEKRWQTAAQKKKNRNVIEKAKGGRRIEIWYDAAEVPAIIRRVEKAVFEDPDGHPVMGYGQALVSVIQSHPQTVREVEAANDGDYPLMPIIKASKQEGLAIRLAEDVAFFVRVGPGVKHIAPPSLLLRSMLQVSPERAPGLVGVLEHPAMAPNGEIISGHGYDYDTGFFKRIPDELVPDLPEQIEQEDAAQALKWIIDNVCADFPFASDSDLAGFLSLLLTAIQRRLISGDEGCPGGGISAPVQASGKTALTQVLFNLVLGRSAAATAWVHDDVEMAKHLLAVLLEGQVYKYALEYAIEGVKADPTRDVPYLPSDNPDGFHAWTTDEVVQFEQTHLIGTKARLALALMLYAGCARRSDVVTLGRQHLTNSGRLQYRQFKGRNKKPVHIDIPLIAELRQVIDSSPCGELTFLVTEFGKPFTSNGFGNWFKKRCREAGLPHCSAHGVRKAAAARLAEVGSSDLEIMAIGGWQTLKEVQRYTKGARKKVLADHGMDKVQTDIDRTKVSNLSRDGT